MSTKKPIWLDCDPGHDDAFAMILAGHHDSLELLGISTVYGNQTVEKTTENALKVAYVSGIENIEIVAGSSVPVMRSHGVSNQHDTAICPEVHGESGLDRFNNTSFPPIPIKPKKVNAFVYMSERILACDRKVTFICTATVTNLALLLRVFPEVRNNIEEIVILGGSVGTGNMGPVTEWNMMIDPEATRIVFECGIKLVQIPLEVTHTALVTEEVLNMFKTGTPFSSLFVDLLLFFQSTYKSVFNFDDPPLHDPLTVAYVINPSLFETKFVRVDIETQSNLSSGQTVVDVFGMTGKPKNVHLATKVNIPEFWKLLVSSFKIADSLSPMNKIQ